MPNTKYLPILELRPAEMLALTELPNKDKDAVVPLFQLRPWGASRTLDRSIERLDKAFGKRRAFLEVAALEYVEPDKRRPVHAELDELRVPANGYSNWLEFLRLPEHSHFAPSVQLGGAQQEFQAQIANLYALGRGLLFRLPAVPVLSVDAVSAVAQVAAALTGGGKEVTYVLDFGKQGEDFSAQEIRLRALLATIEKFCPSAKISISASSFPGSFTSISSQKIFERIFYDRIKRDFSELIYSDRGSARVEKQQGGGGVPAPRIDYAKKESWHFYRQSSPLTSTFSGYQAQALAVMKDSAVWDKGLKLWACQMIEKTAAGDSQGGISSPNRATAARINLHLHRQINFYDDKSFFDTDEEWSD